MIINLILKDIVKNKEFSEEKVFEIINDIKGLNIERIIISPIYYDEESQSSMKEVKKIVNNLNIKLNEQKINLKLYPANLIRDNFESLNQFSNEEVGNLGDTKYIFLNVEETQDIKELIEVIYEFKIRNYTPVLVGIEKMKEITEDNKKIEKLLKEECLFQLDICSLKGDYGKKIKRTAKVLNRNKIYSFVGFENKIKKEYICKNIKEISKRSLKVLNSTKGDKLYMDYKKKIKYFRFVM